MRCVRRRVLMDDDARVGCASEVDADIIAPADSDVGGGRVLSRSSRAASFSSLQQFTCACSRLSLSLLSLSCSTLR
jgi:hypothetical protein